MGYSETECVLCGVSFNIGRNRRTGEPRYMAWRNTGDGVGVPDFDNSKSCLEGSCWLIDHNDDKLETQKRTPTLGDMNSTDDLSDIDRKSDKDYSAPEESDYEELEYVSDDGEDETYDNDDQSHDFQSRLRHDTTSTDLDVLQSDVNMPDIDDTNEEKPSWTFAWPRVTWSDVTLCSTFRDSQIDSPERRLPLDHFAFGAAKQRSEKWEYRLNIEHVTDSPGCESSRCYNGNLISFADMRDCNVFQCLSNRRPGWYPESDDLPYETNSRYTFTGLCGHAPSTDSGHFPRMHPTRHGINEVGPSEYIWDPLDNVAMPFHPYCFDAYSRFSRERHGVVDIDGLMDWHMINGRTAVRRPPDDCDPRDEPFSWGLHPDVKRSRSQWWEHIRGTEYLAANPLFIPGLKPLLESAVTSDPTFDPRKSPFDDSGSRTARAVGTDSFSALPIELKEMILTLLHSSDIANLRMASRSFTHLPNTLWRDLLKSEMPWLWEVWCDDQPFFWAAFPYSSLAQSYIDLAKDQEAWQVKVADVETLKRIIEEEYQDENPDFVAEWKEAATKALGSPPTQSQAWRDEARLVSSRLPQEKTNWYLLYTLVTRNRDGLKGLKNRKRIWAEMERLMERIEYHRGRGAIAPLREDRTC